MPAVISVFTHKAALKQTQILTIRNNCFLGGVVKGFNEKQNFEIVGLLLFLIKNHLFFGIKRKCIMKH